MDGHYFPPSARLSFSMGLLSKASPEVSEMIGSFALSQGVLGLVYRLSHFISF